MFKNSNVIPSKKKKKTGSLSEVVGGGVNDLNVSSTMISSRPKEAETKFWKFLYLSNGMQPQPCSILVPWHEIFEATEKV
jgi:hypothetical protein